MRSATALLIGVVFRVGAFAQESALDPVKSARLHLGYLGVTPGIGLTNLGVDNNVFNETGSPKRDFTFTVQPSLNLWMHTKRGLLSINGRLGFVHFNSYKSESSIGAFSDALYEYEFTRFKPFVSFSGLDSRERPGFEIDARVRRFENTLHAGLQARVASKSNIEIVIRRQTTSYAGSATFLGQRLQDALGRTLLAMDTNWRQRLTPLTMLVIAGSHETERFQFSPFRNSDSLRLKAGFELGQFALIRGTAFIGYRNLKAVHGGRLPPFSGITSEVNVSYTAPTQTRLSAGTTRDVQYSFQIVDPYFLQTGWNVALAQRVIGHWELRFSGGQERLAYRTTDTSRMPPVDRINHHGGGVGYQIGSGMSAGFTIESSYRQSSTSSRRYQAMRSFGSVTYGF